MNAQQLLDYLLIKQKQENLEGITVVIQLSDKQIIAQDAWIVGKTLKIETPSLTF